jgi:uncharacterized protein (TIGR02266 family)
MTQDTRKDRRVKIVSLNVRYKSATVDEFIENHAHDVSRGGIYIKTGNPFPPGTLLKFEIRLASDQAVIAGVGRVVWKRDSTQTAGDRPGGMGVKFIKIDAPSAAVIDKLVNTKSDAGRAYEDEPQPGSETPAPAAAAARSLPAPRTSGAPAVAATARKSTMIGLGISSAPPPRGLSTPPRGGPAIPRPGPTASGFPKTNPDAEMPPRQEQTVMKQAAELLEEALREAGGSMEDVGTNPLFAGTVAAEKAAAAGTPVPAAPPTDGVDPFRDDAAKARALVAEMAPAPPATKKATSEPPQTKRDTPTSMRPDRDKPQASVRPASGRPAPASLAPRPPKKGLSAVVVTFIVLGVAAAAVMVFRETLFRTTEAPAVQPVPPPPPTASAPTGTPATESPATSSTAAQSASASGAPTASAIGTESGTATAASASAATGKAIGAASTANTAAPSATGGTSTAIATATAVSAPPKATAGAATAPVAAPKPKPKPKVDDNPY